jgi:hypothetical protein
VSCLYMYVHTVLYVYRRVRAEQKTMARALEFTRE